MDDVLVLSPTRWKLKGAMRVANQVLNTLGLEKAPDKTFIGRIEKGFDFLGYHYSRNGLWVSMGTLSRFAERWTRLYERNRGRPESRQRLGAYTRRWRSWASGGVALTGVSRLAALGFVRVDSGAVGAATDCRARECQPQQ
jgi:RNA-directed DNA polymerase